MKTNKKFLTILTLCIALLLTACGATDAAGTDKTNESLTETGTVSADSSNTSLDDLYQQENQIFADHEAVWNKVFGMMSKSDADPSANYADYLADTPKQTRTPLQRMNGKLLRTIWKPYVNSKNRSQNWNRELPQPIILLRETIPKRTLPSGISPVRILMVILSMKACFPPMQ